MLSKRRLSRGSVGREFGLGVWSIFVYGLSLSNQVKHV